MNIKDIAATLAILGSGALIGGCTKDKPATEVPAGDEAAPTGDAEAKCSADHKEEGHCGDDAAAPEGEAAAEGEGEASCSADKKAAGESSCGGK